ncbi:MAG: hypothetical protein R3C05_30550 [Pirellulaceae bacterium]
MMMMLSLGCGLTGSGKIKQLEAESERLLSDYRYERERADRLEVLNQSLTQRVDQLEQRLGYRPSQGTDRVATQRQVDKGQQTPFNSPGSSWQPTRR